MLAMAAPASERTVGVAAAFAAVRGARGLRCFATLFILTMGLLMWGEDADARAESRSGFAGNVAQAAIGFISRAAVLDNSLPTSAAQPTYQSGSLGGLFNRPGLLGGFAAGFLGAGVLGLLFGHGAIGELGGVPSFLGILFQFTLLAMLGRLIWSWWRIDSVATRANLSPRQLADAYERSRNEGLLDIGAATHGEGGRESKEEIFAAKE